MRTFGLAELLGLTMLFAASSACAQNTPPTHHENWDFSVWVAGEIGEELTNSFSESQIWSAGIFIGRMITGERLNSWRRGRLEYAADFMPVFETYGNQHVHGYGFEPVIFRWNSTLHAARISPY